MRDRLLLIRDLLAPDGSVWVHLDDAEVHRMRVLLDEVFGSAAFVATVTWEKADSPRNSARQFSTDQDYVIVFGADTTWTPNRLPRTEAANSIYLNPDARWGYVLASESVCSAAGSWDGVKAGGQTYS